MDCIPKMMGYVLKMMNICTNYDGLKVNRCLLRFTKGAILH